MPNTLNITPTAGNLPAGFCPTDYQSMLNAYAAAMNVAFPLGAGVAWLIQSARPTAAQSNGQFAWFQLDDLGRPVRPYWFAQGSWIALHPSPPGLTQWWFAVLPDFTVFDGGDAQALSDYTGPMWQQALAPDGTVIAAQFPVAAGTLPVPPAGTGAVLSVGAKGGEQLHVLTTAEGAQDPLHTHATGRFNQYSATYLIDASPSPQISAPATKNTGDGNPPTTGVIDPAGDSPASDKASGAWTGTSRVLYPADTPPVIAGHNCLPPYVVGYLLQRTSRLFYSVP